MLFVPTRDRAERLGRALQSHHAALTRAGTRVPLVVVDDGHEERTTAAACVAASAAHVGRLGRSRLVEALGATMEEREALGFALLAPSARTTTHVGATRNVALLLAAGSSFVSIDDDSTSDFFAPREPGTLRAPKSPEPIELHAASEITRIEADPWTPHATLLGRSLAHTVSPAAPPAFRVAMTFMGVAGDLGIGNVGQLAYLSTREHTKLSGGLLDTILAGGDAARMARTVQPSLYPFGMMGAFGLDASHLVPPLLPFGRGEDGLFAFMLRLLDTHAAFVHLPIAIAHRWGEARRPLTADFATSLRAPRIAEVVRAVITASWLEGSLPDPAARMRALGARLVASASSLATLDAMYAEQRARQARQVQEAAAACAEGTLREQIDALATSLAAPTPLPRVVEGLDIGDVVARYGRLLEVWPDVWRRASAHASSTHLFDWVASMPVTGKRTVRAELRACSATPSATRITR